MHLSFVLEISNPNQSRDFEHAKHQNHKIKENLASEKHEAKRLDQKFQLGISVLKVSQPTNQPTKQIDVWFWVLKGLQTALCPGHTEAPEAGSSRAGADPVPRAEQNDIYLFFLFSRWLLLDLRGKHVEFSGFRVEFSVF